MKNNKRLQGFIAGVLAGMVAMSAAPGLAKNVSENIEAIYRDIKLVVNGKTVTPTDAEGKETEPFICSGTTYLPVRAVANALGQPVEWDDHTSTVKIGTDTAGREYLTNMAFSSVNPSDGIEFTHGDFPKINMNLNTRLETDNELGESFWTSSRSTIDYDSSGFNGVNFNRFTCTLLPPESEKNVVLEYTVNCMGKSSSERKSYSLIKTSKPVYVDLSIPDCQYVTISARIDNVYDLEEAYALAQIEEPALWQ